MQFVRSGWVGWASVAALTLGLPASAAAQQREVAQGTIVYVEEADGSLTPHRRADAPGEGDGRALLVRVGEDEVPRTGTPTAYLVVPRRAVLSPVAQTGEIEVGEAEFGEIEEEVAAGKAEGEMEAPREVEGARPGIRPRVGVMALGGGMLEDVEGWLVGGALQLGVQLGDWFAIYYQPTGLYAAIDTPAGTDDAFTLWNPLLAELTLFDVVSIAGGPSVDIYEECEANVACSQDDVYFGAHGRVALNLGGMGAGQRHAFQVSFEVHPTWFNDDLMTLSMLGGIGVQMY